MTLDLHDRLALLRGFLEDADGRLARLEAGLAGGSGPASEELVRDAHTLVGAAGVVDLGMLSDAARALESALAAGDGDASRERLGALRVALGAVRGSRRVLAIEDDPTNRMLLDRLAAKDPRVELELASDGETGLRLAAERVPDLILLDLRLPDVTGEEVLARLRSDPRTAGVPVVVLSGHAEPMRVRQLTEAGAAAYLTKPFDLDRLLLLISEGR